MRSFRLALIGALLVSGVSACNNPPAPAAASHPPATDLRCLAEPAAQTDAEVLADVDGTADERWNDRALIAGRSCRDALGRVCLWHRERGDKEAVCDAIPAVKPDS